MSQKALLTSSLSAGLFSTQVWAVEFKVDEDVGCYVGQVHLIQHGDGYVSGSFDSVNMRMVKYSGNSPVNMATLVSAHCVGTFTVLNGEPEENGSCEATDGSSDRYFVLFHRKGDPKKVEGEFHVIHGTGRFAGMSLDLKYKEIGEIPPPGMTNTIGGCDRAVGTGNAPGIK
jgi:hypothetical protein